MMYCNKVILNHPMPIQLIWQGYRMACVYILTYLTQEYYDQDKVVGFRKFCHIFPGQKFSQTPVINKLIKKSNGAMFLRRIFFMVEFLLNL